MGGSKGRTSGEAAGADIRDLIGSRLIIADGSTGTALESLSPGIGAKAALLPLTNPALLEKLHRAYFDAGSMLVETATFSASARSLERFAESGETGINDPAALSYAVNRAGAEAAVRAARESEARTGEPRRVAGSMGPGDAPPSFGMATWSQLKDSYLPQARGLADGGVDLVIIETCQDPLQIKAALAALLSPEGGRGLPFIVSATVDSSHRMLAGTSIAAFVAIVSPYKPLALGLNCSGGPDELEESLAELSSRTTLPLCFMPNAGLPEEVDGVARYPFGPEVFAAKVSTMVARYGVAVVGGCCGTAPTHIAALARALARALAQAHSRTHAPALPQTYAPALPQTYAPALPQTYALELAQATASSQDVQSEYESRPSAMPDARIADAPKSAARVASETPSLASLYEAKPLGQGLLVIGNRANVDRSTSFGALLDAGDFDTMGETALNQEADGASVLDIRLARGGRDEAADMRELIGLIALRARAALCIDTDDPEVAAAVLPLTGGRALIRSTSLADPEKARRLFAIAREHGAAVLCPAVDSEGPALGTAEKARVCRKFYELATGEFGLPPHSLFFDPLVFPLAEFPGSARETLDALVAIRENCPGSPTILEIGRFSSGMPASIARNAEAVFLDLARARGLDAVILDTGSLPHIGEVDASLREAIELRIAGGDEPAGA